MSKFLRQMTALSKKPSDYVGKELVAPTEVAPHADLVVHPVSVSRSVSVPHTDSLPPAHLVDPIESVAPIDSIGRAPRRARPRPARLAQDGHSHAEQAVYAALWDDGTTDSDGNRIVTMGLGRLSKGARLSENNCRLNIRSLVRKLALEEIGAEDSRAGIGKTYKIYSYAAILARRRRAGMEWVIRTKGVAFVDRNGHLISVPPAGSMAHHESVMAIESGPLPQLGSTPEPIGGHDSVWDNRPIPVPPHESAGGPTTNSISPLRNTSGNELKEALSSVETAPLLERLAALGIHLDDDAGRRIISRCQNTDRTATVEEIAFFAELKVKQLAKRRNIEDWPSLLMATVPAFFDSPATELNRFRAQKRLEHEQVGPRNF